jgi:hypothetical protein
MKLGNASLVRDYQLTFETPEGQRVLNDLRRFCPTFMNPIGTGKGVDVNILLVQEGQNNVLKHIYRQMRKDPNLERPAKAVNRTEGE